MRTESTFVGIICTFLTASYCHADVIAASNFPAGQKSTNGWEEVALISLPLANLNNTSWGQSFIATASGLLTTLDTLLAAGIDERVVGSPPLNVSIYASSGGIPAARLGTVPYTAEDFFTVFGSDDHRVTVDFTNLGIPISTGQEFLVAYESPFGFLGREGREAPYLVGLVLDNHIPFGRVSSAKRNGIDWVVTPTPTPPYTFELATRVWVTPEPSCGSLLLVAVLQFVVGQQSRRRLH